MDVLLQSSQQVTRRSILIPTHIAISTASPIRPSDLSPSSSTPPSLYSPPTEFIDGSNVNDSITRRPRRTETGDATLVDRVAEKSDGGAASKEPSIPPMPAHWENEFLQAPRWLTRILYSLFTMLCMVSFGNCGLERYWACVNWNEDRFEAFRDRIASRISTVTVVAGLLLGSTAALITTAPPQTGILDYTQRGPYICLVASFGILLGGLIVGSTEMFVISTCSPRWTCDVLMATRGRIFCVMILLSYPFFSVGVATILCTFGLLVAMWLSADNLVQIGGSFLVIVPSSLVILFVCIAKIKLSTNHRHSSASTA